MKKVLIGMVVLAVAIGFAVNAYSKEAKVEESVKTTEGKTVEKTKVEAGGVKATSETTTTDKGSITKEEVKGKNIEMKKEEAQTTAPVTAGGAEAGKAKVKIKHGMTMNVKWVYWRDKSEYILEYEVKEKGEDLKKALNLTPEQFAAVKPGVHKVVSTSPYTADDIKNDFRSLIVQDLVKSVQGKKAN